MLAPQVEFARALVGPDRADTDNFLDTEKPLDAALAVKAAALAKALLAGFAFRDARGKGGQAESRALRAYERAERALPADLRGRVLGDLMRKLAMADAAAVTQFLTAQQSRKSTEAA